MYRLVNEQGVPKLVVLAPNRHDQFFVLLDKLEVAQVGFGPELLERRFGRRTVAVQHAPAPPVRWGDVLVGQWVTVKALAT